MVHAEARRNSFKNGAFPLNQISVELFLSQVFFVFVSSLYQAATPHNHGSLERIGLKNLTRFFASHQILLPFLLGSLPQYPKLPSLKAPSILTTKHQAVFKYIVLRLFLDIWNPHAIVSSCFKLDLGPSRHHRIIRDRLHLIGHVGCMLALFFAPKNMGETYGFPWFPSGEKKPDSNAFTTGRIPSCITVTLMADKFRSPRKAQKNTCRS